MNDSKTVNNSNILEDSSNNQQSTGSKVVARVNFFNSLSTKAPELARATLLEEVTGVVSSVESTASPLNQNKNTQKTPPPKIVAPTPPPAKETPVADQKPQKIEEKPKVLDKDAVLISVGEKVKGEYVPKLSILLSTLQTIDENEKRKPTILPVRSSENHVRVTPELIENLTKALKDIKFYDLVETEKGQAFTITPDTVVALRWVSGIKNNAPLQIETVQEFIKELLSRDEKIFTNTTSTQRLTRLIKLIEETEIDSATNATLSNSHEITLGLTEELKERLKAKEEQLAQVAKTEAEQKAAKEKKPELPSKLERVIPPIVQNFNPPAPDPAPQVLAKFSWMKEFAPPLEMYSYDRILAEKLNSQRSNDNSKLLEELTEYIIDPPQNFWAPKRLSNAIIKKYNIDVDNPENNRPEDVIRGFQETVGLPVDGVVSGLLFQALIATYNTNNLTLLNPSKRSLPELKLGEMKDEKGVKLTEAQGSSIWRGLSTFVDTYGLDSGMPKDEYDKYINAKKEFEASSWVSNQYRFSIEPDKNRPKRAINTGIPDFYGKYQSPGEWTNVSIPVINQGNIFSILNNRPKEITDIKDVYNQSVNTQIKAFFKRVDISGTSFFGKGLVLGNGMGKRKIYDGSSNHAGFDYGGILNTPFYVPKDGIVCFSEVVKDYGLTVIIYMPNRQFPNDITKGTYMSYSHCNKTNVFKGQFVKEGTIFAYLGASGDVQDGRKDYQNPTNLRPNENGDVPGSHGHINGGNYSDLVSNGIQMTRWNPSKIFQK